MTNILIGVALTGTSIYLALRFARSKHWITVLVLYMVAVMFITTAAKASMDGGWGTTSFNVYEGSMGTTWNHAPQSQGGWSSFWGGLCSFFKFGPRAQ